MRKVQCAVGLVCCVALGVTPLGGAAAAPMSSSVSGSTVVQVAMRYLGYPYTAVGNSPATGFSCIGFVSYVYQSLGINVPDDLGGAIAFAPSVPFSSLEPGDVLFFQNTVWAGLSHTAIYIGGGRFIHAEWYNRGVVISSFTNDPIDYNYWTDHYLGANRPWALVAASVTAPLLSQPAAPVRTIPSPFHPQIERRVPTGPVSLVRVAGLNVRMRPSLRAAIRTVVASGTRLVVLGHYGHWYWVALPGGGGGWVIGAGIGKSWNPMRESSVRSGYSRTYTMTRRRSGNVGLRIQGTVSVSVSGLRVHAGPSIGARVLATAGRGQHLGVLGRAYGWIHVVLPGQGAGWISSAFVSQPVARVRSSVYSRTGSMARVAVNVRQRPALGATILTVLPPGGSYRLLGWSAGWAHVSLSSGAAGWISGTVLGRAPAATAAASERSAVAASQGRSLSAARQVVTAGVKFRAGPGLSSPVISLVAAGTHVQVLRVTGGWTKVRLSNHQTGFIAGAYVATASPTS